MVWHPRDQRLESMASKEKWDPEAEAQLKRLALQVAIQLPENMDDALRVLDLTRGLVTDFLMDSPAAEACSATVVPLNIIR